MPFPRIEALLGVPLGELGEQHLGALIAGSIPEVTDLVADRTGNTTYRLEVEVEYLLNQPNICPVSSPSVCFRYTGWFDEFPLGSRSMVAQISVDISVFGDIHNANSFVEPWKHGCNSSNPDNPSGDFWIPFYNINNTIYAANGVQGGDSSNPNECGEAYVNEFVRTRQHIVDP